MNLHENEFYYNNGSHKCFNLHPRYKSLTECPSGKGRTYIPSILCEARCLYSRIIWSGTQDTGVGSTTLFLFQRVYSQSKRLNSYATQIYWCVFSIQRAVEVPNCEPQTFPSAKDQQGPVSNKWREDRLTSDSLSTAKIFLSLVMLRHV